MGGAKFGRKVRGSVMATLLGLGITFSSGGAYAEGGKPNHFASTYGISVPAYPDGPLTRHTITATLSIPAKDVGSNGKVYVVAVLPSSMGGALYALGSDGGFYPSASLSNVVPYYSGSLSGTFQIPVVATPMDVTSLVGTQIYIGYGRETGSGSFNDMVQNSSYDYAHMIGG